MKELIRFIKGETEWGPDWVHSRYIRWLLPRGTSKPYFIWLGIKLHTPGVIGGDTYFTYRRRVREERKARKEL